MQTSKINKLALSISAFFIIFLILFAIFRDNADLITLSEVKQLVVKKYIEKVVIKENYVYLKTKTDLYKIAISQVNSNLFRNLIVEIDQESNLLIYILFFIILISFSSIVVVYWFKKNKNTDIFSGLAKNRTSSLDSKLKIEAVKSSLKFDDIGGISDVKVELEEIIDFMKNPKRYKKFGARMPKGVLLVGPPGVGKTMVAKAVANEAKVPFYYQSGASFVQIYVGMGAQRVHELFLTAKNNSPSIIFIDEIDAVGKKRDGTRNDEREATLNQLLTEMDGFEDSSGVIVVAATNKIDILDSALLRAGRFDRRIFVELPTKTERESILEKHLRKIPSKLDIVAVSNMTVGFNGASLATLVNEAVLLALRERASFVDIDHFHSVKDKVVFGKKKLRILNSKQKDYKITYQSAKVLCASYFDLQFEKLMLSNEQLTPSSEDPLIKVELESRIKMLLAGIGACEIKYKEHDSNSERDLDEAKEIVSSMINNYGMGKTLMPGPNEEESLIMKLYEDVKVLLKENVETIKKIELVLKDKESITKAEVKAYLDEIL